MQDMQETAAAQLALDTQPLRFLYAYWRVWQSLAAGAEAQLQQRHGLDLRAFLVLSYLSGGVMHPSELAGVLGLPRYVVSRTLDSLARLHATARAPDAADARRQRLQLSPQGRALWLAALATVREVCGAPLNVLGDDLDPLTAALERLAEAGLPAVVPHDSSPQERDV